MKFSDNTSWPFLNSKSTENRLTSLTACKAPVPQVSCLRGNHLSVILHSRITFFTFLSCSECSVSASYFSCWHRKHHQHPRRCHWQSSSTTVGCHWQSSSTTVECHWQSSSTTVGCHWHSGPTTVGCHWQSSSTTVGSGVRLPAACNASLFLTARRFSGSRPRSNSCYKFTYACRPVRHSGVPGSSSRNLQRRALAEGGNLKHLISGDVCKWRTCKNGRQLWDVHLNKAVWILLLISPKNSRIASLPPLHAQIREVNHPDWEQ